MNINMKAEKENTLNSMNPIGLIFIHKNVSSETANNINLYEKSDSNEEHGIYIDEPADMLYPWNYNPEMKRMLDIKQFNLSLFLYDIRRFFVIVYPIRARRLCTVSKSRKGLFIVWTSSIILATPVLVTKEIQPITYYNNITSVTAYYCWDDDDFVGLCVAIYQLLIMFILPAILMLICYFCVIQELWSSTKVIRNMTRSSSQRYIPPTLPMVILDENRTTSRTYSYKREFNSCAQTITSTSMMTVSPTVETTTSFSTTTPTITRKFCHSYRRNGSDVKRVRKQVIKMLLFVIIVFLLCWGPRLIMNVVIKFGISTFNNYIYTMRVTCNLLSFVHSALNPFVYGFMSSSFRQMMINSCSAGRSVNNQNNLNNLDPLANHHIIGCVNIKTLFTKSKQRRASDAYDPSCTGTSNLTIPLSVNINGLTSPLPTTPSPSRHRVI
ncbi:hypothetical protein B4U79_04261 [Dinothrombium tinctorium]|uniref:G-protein coupled receptors family 1 profile domain-containing protein n=1 Tax=Dinothrombium tinctorium TaxID=1965070 RepID=A0A3S3PB78_9ACAR|nr:hypothetical protein B4U79_04261 [Dinothrombium tinctorium]